MERRDWVARAIVDSAYTVHRALGPGLLESVYETCLAHELESRGFAAQRQTPCPVVYNDVRLDAGYRIDLLIEQLIAIEIKATERLVPVHTAQLLTYMKLSHLRLGFLMNFNVPVIKDGIRRVAL